MTLRRRPVLALILALALALRLAYALSQDHLIVYGGAGGDSGWYLQYGRWLVTGQVPAPPPSAPFYLIFLGFWQTILPPQAAIVAVRVAQSLLGTATCYFAFRLAHALTDDERAGLLAAGALAVSPAFVIEPAQITTETLYMFFVTAGLWAYTRLVKQPQPTPKYTRLMLLAAALLFGLATLTRAVALLFPLGLAAHWLVVKGRAGLWSRLRQTGLLLVVYALVVSIWTVYNLARWNYVVIGAQGMFSFLYLGASDQGWTGPYQVDERLQQEHPGSAQQYDVQSRDETFRQAAAASIASNPLGWVGRRLGELAGAYLQPHGTVSFPGASLKDMTLNWIQHDRTPGGLLRLTQGDYFWPKLAIYVFHYIGLLAGLAGMGLYRRRWRVALPMIGFIAYTTLIHLVLLALPRYIFPTTVFWWVFAAASLIRVSDWRFAAAFRRKTGRRPSSTPSQMPSAKS